MSEQLEEQKNILIYTTFMIAFTFCNGNNINYV